MKHESELLVGSALIGIGGIVYGTTKATKGMSEKWPTTYSEWCAKHQTETGLSSFVEYNRQKIKVCWPEYCEIAIPVAVTSTSIILAYMRHKKAAAALMTAYGVAQSNYDDLYSASQKLLTKGQFEKITQAIAEEHANKDPDKIDERVAMIKNKPAAEDPLMPGVSVMYDDVSQRYFYASIESLQRVQAELNAYLSEGYENITINDVYEQLANQDLEPLTRIGNFLGWESCDFSFHKLEFDFIPEIDKETGEPYIVFHMNPRPFSGLFVDC